MEQSRGQIGIGKIDAFGPYGMPKSLFQYVPESDPSKSAAASGSVRSGN
jgi:hypothetical protein